MSTAPTDLPVAMRHTDLVRRLAASRQSASRLIEAGAFHADLLRDGAGSGPAPAPAPKPSGMQSLRDFLAAIAGRRSRFGGDAAAGIEVELRHIETVMAQARGFRRIFDRAVRQLEFHDPAVAHVQAPGRLVEALIAFQELVDSAPFDSAPGAGRAGGTTAG